MSAETAAAEAPHALVGDRHESVELAVFPPAIAREEVQSSGRVGAVAYPYRVYEAEVEVDRPLLSPRRDRRVVSVDCSRRLALRADTVPEFETRTVEDALVLPSELSPEQADEKARDAAFRWTLRTSILADVPDVEFARVADAYKLFWLAERPDGDVIIDSLDGSERQLNE
ncbi:hypothetical protein [Halorussus sp. MSC15.2]|uniref:hypothetical protein n=1 Tax=Halorussus sp. MSC15.2 TaxID=2283638 RepID=UPI0013CF9008|nr:hypothetical protein [Halorussus sp. MSC15.2]NEU57207.1 hypothetical protein [Halorussus sp. MSC15.2]